MEGSFFVLFLLCRLGAMANVDPWLQWLYIIVGAVNFVLAAASLKLLPNLPESNSGSQNGATSPTKNSYNMFIFEDMLFPLSPPKRSWQGTRPPHVCL